MKSQPFNCVFDLLYRNEAKIERVYFDLNTSQVEKNGALTTVNVTNTVQYPARNDLRRLITVFDKKTDKYNGSTVSIYVKPLTPQLRSTKMVRFNPYLPKVQVTHERKLCLCFALTFCKYTRERKSPPYI